MSKYRLHSTDPRGIRDTFQVSFKFDKPAGLSGVLEMPHLPSCNDRLLIIFLGDFVESMKWSPGFYEVVESTPDVRPENKYAGAVSLKRLSSDQFPEEVGEDCYVVRV